MPRNLDIPYPISNQPFGALNYAEGLKFPVLQLPAIPMDMYRSNGTTYATPWFTGTNLQSWMITRTGAPCFDLGDADIVFSDNGVIDGAGVGSFFVPNAKPAGFTLRIRKGEVIAFMMRWAGTERFLNGQSLPASLGGGTVSIVAPSTGLEGVPINYSRVTLGGGFADLGIIGITVNFDTGLTPNMELNGRTGVSEHNADLPTCTVVLECHAYPGVDVPGFDYSDPDAYPEVTNGQILIRHSASAASNQDMRITFPRLVIQDPDDRTQQAV